MHDQIAGAGKSVTTNTACVGSPHLEDAGVVADDVEDAAAAVEDVPVDDDGAEGEADLAGAHPLEDEQEDQDGDADADDRICTTGISCVTQTVPLPWTLPDAVSSPIITCAAGSQAELQMRLAWSLRRQ